MQVRAAVEELERNLDAKVVSVDDMEKVTKVRCRRHIISPSGWRFCSPLRISASDLRMMVPHAMTRTAFRMWQTDHAT